MQLQGKITISRPSYSSGRQAITIQVQDAASGVQFLDIELTLEQFARAVTGQGHVEMEMEARALDLVGMRREVKEERVFVPESSFARRKTMAKMAVEALEADGWAGRAEDALNMHRISGRTEEGYYATVTYTRHVPA